MLLLLSKLDIQVNQWIFQLNGRTGVAKNPPYGFGPGNVFGEYMVINQHPGEEIV